MASSSKDCTAALLLLLALRHRRAGRRGEEHRVVKARP
jgi:hypothetical protein